ncbi:MAG: ParB N-terminal domain-containing protein, partial [Muribaculaceae bacterium]|nr:ParB N-terminal domain-containing protein [Muribaculaceae bacterium]
MDYKTEAQPKAWADGVPVHCAHDAIVDVTTLVPNPKNPNTHPDTQIQLLGRVIRQTGWRQPITVSKRSGFIVKG